MHLLAITSLNIVKNSKIYPLLCENVIGGLPFPLLPYRLYHLVFLDERASPQFSRIYSTYFEDALKLYLQLH